MIQQVISRPHSSYMQKKLTYKLVCYIISYAEPIHIVEDNNFRLWAKSLDSQFEIPCVNTIKTIIFNSYNSTINQIIDLILKTSNTVSLTFDIWTSQTHDSYLEITCHWLTDSFELYKVILDIEELDKHNAFDIIESVNSVLNKFNIDHSKIFTITTDNGSNVKSAVQQLNITNVKCTGHTFQLSVNLDLKEVDNLISKCKSLIAILSKEKKCKQLHKAQLQITPGLKQPLDIIKDVNTCWNFILYTIEHIMHLKPAIIQLYLTLTNHTIREIRKGAETIGSFIPSTEEFELLEELIEILFPFDEVTQFLSRSKYSTLRFITPILEELAHQFRYFTGKSNKAILVKEMILDNLIKRWGDPRCKHKTLFSTMMILARRYLVVLTSSVPSEQLFSDAGNHMMNKHNRLSLDLLNQL
ncbi:1541_t:CDS:2, partial [Cetraspora pellucida]